MKTSLKHSLIMLALVATLESLLPRELHAQTFMTLHNFSAFSRPGINSDGAGPTGLVLSSSTLYGTAHYDGGSSDAGTLFAVNTDGTGFTTIYNFTGGADGVGPDELLSSGNTIYGTTGGGGYSGAGTVFAVNSDGTGFTTLHSFTASTGQNADGNTLNSDGSGPDGLILSGNTLYGTAVDQGSGGSGTIFDLKIDGTGFTILHSFSPTHAGKNGDGRSPFNLMLSGNTLYGGAVYGGIAGNGTIWAMNSDGTGFTNLHTFAATRSNPSGVGTNSDGASPFDRLLVAGSTLYGTTYGGGSSGNGTVFKLNTDGTGFTTLHTFIASSTNSSGVYTNSDGANPFGFTGGLILSGSTLYGRSTSGGSWGNGTVFALNTDGTGFVTLHSFTGGTARDANTYTNSDGAGPLGELILSGNTLYGTASSGGTAGNGTIFSISLPPRLTIAPAAANVMLAWPTNATGFTLQSTTNLVSTAAWTTVSAAPVVVNGQNTMTIPISGTQQFYRLAQ